MSGGSGGRLALTVGGAVVGAAIGYFAGNPLLGAQLGATAGTIAGGYVFPEPGPEGPRLADLSVTASSYGEPIKIAYGTMRLNGNVIWAKPLRERDKGGGKGMSAEPVTYEYYGSWAVALAEGPAEKLLRIWFDSKIVFDATQASVFTKQGVKFRFYKGDEDQFPDAAIVADKGDETPGYRGICYIVFDDVRVDDYGRRIPQVTVEVAFKSAPYYPKVAADFYDEFGWSSAYRTTLNVDWTRRMIYLQGQDADDIYYLGAVDLDTMQGLYTRSYDDIRPGWEQYVPQGAFFVGEDGYGYIQTEEFGSDFTDPHDLVQVDLNSFAMRARAAASGLRPPSKFFNGVTAGIAAPTGEITWYVILQGLIGQPYCAFTSDTLTYLGEVAYSALGELGGRNGPMVAKPPEPGIAPVAYAFTNHVTGGGNISVVKLTIADIVDPETALPGQALQAGIIETWTENGTFPDTLEDMDTYGLAWFDPFTRYYFIRVKGDSSTGNWLVKWREDTGIVAIASFPSQLEPYSWEAGHTVPYTPNGILLWPTGRSINAGTYNEVLKIDLGSMQVIDTLDSDPPGVDFQRFFAFAPAVYDGEQNAILLCGGSGFSLGYYERATGQAATLADVVTDLCHRAGLDTAGIDVTELTDAVRGYALTNRMTVRDAIEPLAACFFFDGVESDGKIKFMKRGRASSATIPQRDLGAVGDNGDCWEERRRQDAELPMAISLTYIDPDRDYQQGTQMARRAHVPVATMQARAHVAQQHTIVLSADEAKRIVERWLYTTWLERVSYTAQLGPHYLKYDPADALQAQMDAGDLYRVRLHKIDVGADQMLQIEAFAENAAVYSSTAVGDAGDALVPAVLSDEQADPIVVDTPLLRDADYVGDAVSTYYLSAVPVRTPAATWGGAAVYRSPDGAHWGWRATVRTAPVYGYAVDALANTASPFAPDTVNTLRVRMVTPGDGLDSITDLALVNGSNAALLGDEVIQFRDAKDLGNGIWQLSYLLRGRRGTDVFTSSHQAGELLLLLATDWMGRDTIETALINTSFLFVAVARGGEFVAEAAIHDTLHGRDLKPYAPVNAARSDAGGDITLTWVRRTRVGGDWGDGTGEVPLSETSESYDIDILAGEGGALKRTLTATEASVVYTAAQISADFGSPPATLYARIYQRNAVIGRGFWYEWGLVDGEAGIVVGKGE